MLALYYIPNVFPFSSFYLNYLIQNIIMALIGLASELIFMRSSSIYFYHRGYLNPVLDHLIPLLKALQSFFVSLRVDIEDKVGLLPATLTSLIFS